MNRVNVILLTSLLFILSGYVFAQNPDTLQIMITEGSPGDTVELDVDMYNHSTVIRAMQLGIVYDENILIPIAMEPTYRTQFFGDQPNVWMAMYDTSIHSIEPGQIRLIAYDAPSPPNYFIEIGRGPIATIRFVILENAEPGFSIVGFEGIEANDNILSDSLGNSFVPELIDGGIMVFPESYECDYIPGDVNGDGQVIGSDVTYGINFLKNIGNNPPDFCWNSSAGEWLYSAADVNGDCRFIGSDITFLINYFRTIQPEIHYCPETPPVSPAAGMGR